MRPLWPSSLIYTENAKTYIIKVLQMRILNIRMPYGKGMFQHLKPFYGNDNYSSLITVGYGSSKS